MIPNYDTDLSQTKLDLIDSILFPVRLDDKEDSRRVGKVIYHDAK